MQSILLPRNSPAKRGSLLGDVALMLLARGVSMLLGLLTGIITARSLGPSGKGVFTIALLIPTFMMWFGTMGINAANIYLLGTSPGRSRQIIGNSLYASVCAASTCLVLFWLSYPLTRDSIFRGMDASHLFLASLAGSAQLIYAYGNSILVGQRRFGAFNFLLLLQSGAYVALLAVFLAYLRMGIHGALVAVLISNIITAAATVLMILKNQHGPPSTDSALFKAALKYGAVSFAYGICFILLLRADTFLVNAWRSSKAEVGFYSIAVTFAEVFKSFAEVLNFVLLPRLSSRDPESGAALILTMSRISLFACLLTQAIVIPISPWLIRITFGVEFLPALGPVRILMLSLLSLVLCYNLGPYLAGNGFVWQNLWGSLAGLLTMLGLDFYWIPGYGIVGAAWASLAAYTVMAGVHAYFFRRLTGHPLRELFIVRFSDLHDLFRLLPRVPSERS